jgi:hypothetical protein
LFADHLDDLASFAQHLIARNAHHPVALPGEKIVSDAISILSGTGEVIRSIDFEDQFQLDAAEIGGVRRDRMLAAKLLVADLPVADPLPDRVRKLVGACALGAGSTR